MTLPKNIAYSIDLETRTVEPAQGATKELDLSGSELLLLQAVPDLLTIAETKLDYTKKEKQKDTLEETVDHKWLFHMEEFS